MATAFRKSPWGYHFETVPEKSIGNVLILKSGPDPRQPWTAREIDRIPTVHRLRWIDLAGDGKKVLLVAPMIGLKAVPPDYADNVPVYLYRPGEWKRELFTDQPRGILHSITPVRWQGRGEQLMTADFLGIRVFLAHGPVEIAKGDPRPCPQCGSSEIKIGHLGKRRFIAAIEPWHGNQVVVYTEEGRTWKRHVIEDAMVNGHALAVGDLNGDGRDEIVAGFRGTGFQLYIFTADDAAGQTLDAPRSRCRRHRCRGLQDRRFPRQWPARDRVCRRVHREREALQPALKPVRVVIWPSEAFSPTGSNYAPPDRRRRMSAKAKPALRGPSKRHRRAGPHKSVSATLGAVVLLMAITATFAFLILRNRYTFSLQSPVRSTFSGRSWSLPNLPARTRRKPRPISSATA